MRRALAASPATFAALAAVEGGVCGPLAGPRGEAARYAGVPSVESGSDGRPHGRNVELVLPDPRRR